MNANIEWFRFGYDFHILRDLMMEEDPTKPCHCKAIESGGQIECPRHENLVPCFALGERGDRSVGINQWEATKWFKSVEELEAWCSRNRATLERLLEELFGLDGNNLSPDWDRYAKAMEALQ